MTHTPAGLNPTLTRLSDLEARILKLERNHEMTHELSPAQEAAHGLPTDVLARAAEAMYRARDFRTSAEEQLLAALPVLRPAIERALLNRMIADADGIEAVRVSFSYYRYTDLAAWLAEFLPHDRRSHRP